MFSPDQIAQATQAPIGNVQTAWPLVAQALQLYCGADRPVLIAAAATIAVETGSFRPIEEEGDWNYFLSEFHSAFEAQYHGRGFIQLSWSYNYSKYGNEMGVDLLNNPALALDPNISAKVLALYFRDCGIPGYARAGNWQQVRVAVNGGLNGWDTFSGVVNMLSGMPDSAPQPPVAPQVNKLTVDAALKPTPDHTSVAVADLKAGCTVAFDAPDGHPYGITPHWAKVLVTGGTTQKLKNAVGLKGWLLREDLQLTGM